MASQVKLVLVATSCGEQGISPGLSDVAGVPLVTYWIQALRACPRLLPVAEKVYIVTSPDTHDTFLQWCSHKDFSLGFPPSNLINIGGPSAGLLADAAFAVQAVPGMRDGYVVVASLEAFLGPVIPLRQLVEHTVVRGKDTLAFYYPPPGSRMQGQAQVTFDMAATTTITGEYVNPRVGAVDAAAGGQADGLETTGMAPVLILHRSSVPLLEQAARSGGGPSPASSVSPAQQLGSFVQGVLIGNGKPVYALGVDMCIDVFTEPGLAYTNAYMEYFHAEIDKAGKQGGAAEALAVVTAAAQESGVISRGEQVVEDLLAQASPARRLLLKFDAVAPQLLAAKAGTGPKATFVKFGIRDELPERFKDVTTRRHNSKYEHPCYTTTNNEFGRKPPSQLDMPDVYAGSAGGFSKTFTGGPYKHRGLNTGVTKSKVHKLLDDF